MKKSISWKITMFIGILLGIIIIILDHIDKSKILFISFASGSIGIWIIISILIMYFSSDNKKIFINVLVFLCSMCLTYYAIKDIIDSMISYQTISNMTSGELEQLGLTKNSWISFSWDKLIVWLVISFGCAFGCYVLNKVKKRIFIYYILSAIPLFIIFLEGINFAKAVMTGRTGLCPAVINFLGGIVCIALLVKNQKE
ncbi:MAG: hypothetical protein FWC47_03235 [Oscillospiraceae bacterium]|nr:hypothetical protein [Oscillospiraceae bacterium]